jgi:2-polyprenyl-6-methoxyphenol hydroxylase-like FAD-dependent oxidoreductase
MERVDVVIVGAGPVGALLAGELRLRGIEVLVLERLKPSGQSRARQSPSLMDTLNGLGFGFAVAAT